MSEAGWAGTVRARLAAADRPGPWTLHAPEPGTRGRHWRLVDGAGATVHVREADDTPAGRDGLARELAALRALDGAAVAPALLHGDADACIAVTADAADECGAGAPLAEGLRRDADTALGAGLDALARPMARLAALPVPTDFPGGAAAEFRRLTDALARLDPLLEGAGVPVRGRALAEALAPLADAWTGRGASRGASHGDPAPSNNHLGSRDARLLDFEYAAVRHRLFDLAQWQARIPLPRAAFARLVAPHRDALVGPGRPWTRGADFDAELDRVVLVSVAYRLVWLPTAGIDAADRPWVGPWSVRAALLEGLRRVRERTACAPAFAAPLTDLHAALAERWPEAEAARVDWHDPAAAGPR